MRRRTFIQSTGVLLLPPTLHKTSVPTHLTSYRELFELVDIAPIGHIVETPAEVAQARMAVMPNKTELYNRPTKWELKTGRGDAPNTYAHMWVGKPGPNCVWYVLGEDRYIESEEDLVSKIFYVPVNTRVILPCTCYGGAREWMLHGYYDEDIKEEVRYWGSFKQVGNTSSTRRIGFFTKQGKLT